MPRRSMIILSIVALEVSALVVVVALEAFVALIAVSLARILLPSRIIHVALELVDSKAPLRRLNLDSPVIKWLRLIHVLNSSFGLVDS